MDYLVFSLSFFLHVFFFFFSLSYDFFFVCAFALEPFALGLLALLDKFQILHARTHTRTHATQPKNSPHVMTSPSPSPDQPKSKPKPTDRFRLTD